MSSGRSHHAARDRLQLLFPSGRLILATRNLGKVRELRALLADTGLELVGLDAFPELSLPPEIGDTFVANALIKARAARRATGSAAAADDSGIRVDALDGAPGVYSARFAGPAASDDDNNRLLIQKLRGLPATARGARYHCAAALVLGTGEEVVVEAEVSGRILEEPRGAGGFGYDPYFFYEEFGCTFGEANATDKNRVSHRGKAFRELARVIGARLESAR